MERRIRTWPAPLALLFALLLALVSGCSTGSASQSGGRHETLPLSEAPADLQALYEQSKGVPGLYVFTQGKATFLLLMAGRLEVSGVQLEVFEVGRPVNGEVRILAALRPGKPGVNDPAVVIRLEGASAGEMRYKARISGMSEQVNELRGIPLADR